MATSFNRVSYRDVRMGEPTARTYTRLPDRGSAMPTSVWKGSISFGLVSVPIRLYAAARSTRINLHQLHSVCHTRLKQPLFCPACNRFVERAEVVKGYESEKGKYVLVEPAEIQRIAPESKHTMDIVSFVKASEIDPLYFDSSYFAVAEEEGQKAYQLLLKVLEDSQRVGIAKITMHQREYVVFMRPYKHGLTLHTMYFANEIREAPGYGKNSGVKIRPQDIKLAEQLVDTLSEDFHLANYHDEYQSRLKALIEAKEKGREVAADPSQRRAPVIDMMTALKESLAKKEKAKPMRAKPEPAAHRRRATHRAAS